jgi:hypothetical protein
MRKENKEKKSTIKDFPLGISALFFLHKRVVFIGGMSSTWVLSEIYKIILL